MDTRFDNKDDFPINKDIFDDYSLATPPKSKKGLPVRPILLIALIALAIYYFFPSGSSEEKNAKEEIQQYKVAKKNMPEKLPSEFTPVSNFYDIDIIDPDIIGKKISISLKLTEQIRENDEPFFYYYDSLYGTWHRLSKATTNLEGTIASGQIAKLPNNIMVVSAPDRIRQLSYMSCLECDSIENIASNSDSIFFASPDLTGIDGKITLRKLGTVDVNKLSSSNFFYGVEANEKRTTEIINYILEDSNRIDEHIQNIVAEVKQINTSGIHINYQNIKLENKKSFTNFINKLHDVLSTQTLGQLIVSLPVSDDIPNDSYEWQKLFSIVEKVWIHPSEDGSKFYKELDHLSEISQKLELDSSKMHLVINSISRERSMDGIDAISRVDALKIASDFSVKLDEKAVTTDSPITLDALNLNTLNTGNNKLSWDDVSKSISFRYVSNGSERTIWIQNSFSLRFQIYFAEKNNFAGIVLNSNELDKHTEKYWQLFEKYLTSAEIELLKPFDDYVRLDWTSSGGVFENNSGESITWRSPKEPGAYSIQLSASDGEVFLSTELIINVIATKNTASLITQLTKSLPNVIIKPFNIIQDELKKPVIEEVAKVEKKQDVEVVKNVSAIKYRPIPIGPPGPAGN